MRRAAGAHVVFRVDFEKPELGPGVDNSLEMLGLESDADIRRAQSCPSGIVGHARLSWPRG